MTELLADELLTKALISTESEGSQSTLMDSAARGLTVGDSTVCESSSSDSTASDSIAADSIAADSIAADSIVTTLDPADRVVKLRQELDQLLSNGVGERHWFQCEQLERLLQRASEETAGIAEYLLTKAEQRLVELAELTNLASSSNTAEASSLPRKTAQSLTDLIAEIQPETPRYDESSRGAAFDEFLQQQENNILQTMVGDSSEADTTAVAPALTRANRYLRHRQLQSSAARLVDVAIEHGPENPGPLNPEMLSIKSLKLMRDLSPQYLNRFVAFIDSMLWIEESTGAKVQSKPKQKSKSKSKSKPGSKIKAEVNKR
ncbi:MAG: DUF2894 domain-containing protein [Cellvibrionaceae bacterium]